MAGEGGGGEQTKCIMGNAKMENSKTISVYFVIRDTAVSLK